MSSRAIPYVPSHNLLRVELDARQVVGYTESPFTLRGQEQRWPGEAWKAAVELPPMGRDDAARWKAFLLRARANGGRFLMGPDARERTIRGSGAGAPCVDEDAPSGHEIATRGWTANQSGVLREGDYFQVGDDDGARIYMVTADVDSDGSGEATVPIWPEWRDGRVSDASPAEDVANGGMETGDPPTGWTNQDAANTTVARVSGTPGPNAGTYSMKYTRNSLAGGYSAMRQLLTGLIPGYPYRLQVAVRAEANVAGIPLGIRFETDGAAATLGGTEIVYPRWTLPNGTKGIGSPDGLTGWRVNGSPDSASPPEDTATNFWQLVEAGIWIPTRHADHAVNGYNLDLVNRAGALAGLPYYVAFDSVSVYGPTWDGAPLILSNPVGCWRFAEPLAPWSLSHIAVSGLSFECMEAV